MKKQIAAYHVHLSAVKNTQRKNNGIERMRKLKPTYTNEPGLRNANSEVIISVNMMS